MRLLEGKERESKETKETEERKRNVQWRNTRAGEINYLPHRRPPDQRLSVTSVQSNGQMQVKKVAFNPPRPPFDVKRFRSGMVSWKR